jgi:hypothetical protein
MTTVFLDNVMYSYMDQTLLVGNVPVDVEQMFVDRSYLTSILPPLSVTGFTVLFMLPCVDPGVYILYTKETHVYNLRTDESVPLEDVAMLLSYDQVLRRTFTSCG